MSLLTYIDQADPGEDGWFTQHKISDLISLLLESQDASDALRRVNRLIQLLLLSNHIDKAYTLICALYEYHSLTSSNQDAFQLSSRPFDNFWEAHSKYNNPFRGHDESSDMAFGRKERLERQQWHEYRECTRTGWMLEHCTLPEPEDVHIWRETDDEPTIAMCARLLAKSKTIGQYPTRENMVEALAASKKLYAQPQVPITEWEHKRNGHQTVRRHSYLLYRRLVVELAIRLEEFDTAAEVLSLGLRLDGFNDIDGGQLDRYLFLPGIYKVLPLLAQSKKEGNPFYIEADEAGDMIEQVIAALTMRAQNGRQWSLAPERVGWKELLDRLATAAWMVNRKEYQELGLTCAEDILYSPATEEEISEAEAKVGELPSDFKDMVRVANGFQGGWHFLNGGINGLDNIGLADDDVENYTWFLGDLDQDVYSKVIALSPATECDDFMHFMISPAHWRKQENGNGETFSDGEYPYWQWASWQAGETSWHSFREWVATEVEKLERMVKRAKTLENDN
ncbi:cell wall assembly cell proliferation coordinating KNR4-like [Fusarium pseudoanthophilum]|uniref:Cell wall assembly cell proliferation coordinating KNR4-like n=1 Tax=Fusarium pseudoanthophilum TaxID=48495 RepID=A0A8H5NLY7_9HYPO|nr:cell wall assembly cell proliferation coordinating KNR4-like [Fusarium pseudoanthophilum]